MITSNIGEASPSVAIATQRAADRPDERVNGVPERVDPRNLVGDELDGVQHQRQADDPVVGEDLILRRQVDPVEPRRQAEDGHGRVEIDARRQRETRASGPARRAAPYRQYRRFQGCQGSSVVQGSSVRQRLKRTLRTLEPRTPRSREQGFNPRADCANQLVRSSVPSPAVSTGSPIRTVT